MTTRRKGETRLALIEAAEPLLAKHGIEGVELREILRTARQRNRSAIQYHFGDRYGLVEAIIVRRRNETNRMRVAQLNKLERQGALSIRSLVDAWVTPMATALATASGRNVLIITTEMTARLGSKQLLDSGLSDTEGLARLANALIAQVEGTPQDRTTLVASCLMTTPTLLADLARDINVGNISLRQARRRQQIIIDLTTRALGGT